MAAPRFSVVIPVYNRASTVGPTLESVRAQTFGDFECIVVDDGSEDGEALRAAVEALNDARFRYVRRENGGGGAARNTGIDEAKGDYIAFLDSDDRWLPDKLERDSPACGENCIVFSPVLVERGGCIVGKRPKVSPRTGEPIAEYLACRGGFTPTSTITLPSKLAKRIHFDGKLPSGQDTDFAIRLAFAGGEFQMIAEGQTVMNDDDRGDRVSRSHNWRAVLAWLNGASSFMTRRAYLAYRGWHIARMAASAGERRAAMKYYSAAVVAGAFSAPIAAKALGQIMIPRSIYAKFRQCSAPHGL